MENRTAPRLAAALLALAAAAAPARAGFVPISQPNPAYLASTTKLEIPTSGPPVSSLAAGDLTITLSDTMGPLRLASWGSPSNVEDTSPPALGFGVANVASSRLLTFSQPLEVFGVEMRYNLAPLFFPFNLTAEFFSGATRVGSISRSFSGGTGALLFAATDLDAPFTSVRLSAPAASWGFLIADVRETAVPEPSGLALLLSGAAAAAGHAWRRRKRAAT